MTVALDVDVSSRCTAVEVYVKEIVAALLPRDRDVQRIILLTNTDNHARFETLRDEHCDVAMVHRPLFEGRTVADWPALLSRYPATGAELLAHHLQAKLRIIRDLAVDVVHFPDDASAAMDLDAPIVVSLHGGVFPTSACRAHAVVLESEGDRQRLCRELKLAPAKVFVATPGQVSTNSPPEADDDHNRRSQDFAAAICEAYEHALASFELKNAA